jgi:hypothetical protein
MPLPTDRISPSLQPIPPDDSASEQESKAAALEKAFGIWPDVEGGLAYQERMRSEWEDYAGE